MATLETPVTSRPIVELTERALAQVRRQRTKLGKENEYLRVGVRGGGCSGLSYVIDWESEPDPEFDTTWEQDDVSIVVDVKSARFLADSTLDYDIRNLMEGGYVFDNPHALRSCGCGTSFTLK